jgi:hypothetical protein
MDKQLQEYRSFLIAAEQKAHEDFDKTVLSLSGGALGISFAFVKDIVGSQPLTNSAYLLISWIAWGISVTCVLASFYFSQQALRHAIKQVDKEKIYSQIPGGLYSHMTAVLNALGGLLFLAGIVFIIIFVSYNLR